MNRLTNEQHLQIIEFYCQNACSLKKVHLVLLQLSDEAHLWLNGYVNKQNCRFWSEDEPEALQELSVHPEKVTVWCGLWPGGIIGQYFFKDDANRNVTMNVGSYRAMIKRMNHLRRSHGQHLYGPY